MPVQLVSLAKCVHFVRRLQWRVARPTTVGVRLLAVKEGRVLLVKHTYLDSWYLPGGGVQPGETLREAVIREAAEEAGAGLGDLKLFGVYSNFLEGKSDHIVVFLCEEFSWRKMRSGEIECVDCFAFGELPEDTSPGTRRRIAEFAAGEMAVAAPW